MSSTDSGSDWEAIRCAFAAAGERHHARYSRRLNLVVCGECDREESLADYKRREIQALDEQKEQKKRTAPSRLDRATAKVDAIAAQQRPRVLTLAQILADPAALDPPQAVAPRLAYKGRVTLLAAREKVGKSTLAAAAAAAVSRGGPFLDGQTIAGPVLWLLLEEHIADLARRLVRFDADPDRVLIIDRPSDPLGALRAALDETKAVLAVVDTLAQAAGGRVKESSSSAEWTPVLTAIERAARETEAAILPLHHGRKSDGAYRDSSAIGAGVDLILEMAPHEIHRTVRRLRAKGRFPVEDTSLVYLGDRFEIESGGLTVEAQVMAFIATNPGSSSRQVVRGVAARDSEITSALKRLGAAGAIENRGGSRGNRFFPGQHPGNAAVAGVSLGGQSPATVRQRLGNGALPPLGKGRATLNSTSSLEEVEL